LYETLASDERERSARFRLERDRQRFIVARGVLRELLARYFQTDPGRVSFVYNAFGKPHLGPEFGGRLKFNLSHSAELALIAVAVDSDVGVDLEYVRTEVECDEIARSFFSAAEAHQITTLPSDLRAEAFFVCWTKKEAYVKGRGESLAAALNSFSVPLKTDSADRSSDVCVAANGSDAGKHWSLFTLRPAPGYIGALAVEGTGWRVNQRQWEMRPG
jgi:4'-phosphopantetheinyl transferase